MTGLGWPECVCNVGVQECPIHPGRLLTTLERILNEKDWDRRVKEGKTKG